MTSTPLRTLEKTHFEGEIVVPGDPAYEALRRGWNATNDRRPALIVRCAGAADVARAVEMARDGGLPLSVFGGGHSFPGHSVCEGGVMIDLRPMKGVEVDPEAAVCRAEAGLTWAELDDATQEHGLAVTGGRMSTTGIAGLTLGGGSGWLERKCGYTVDNLLSVEIVTADGQLLVASENENPQLFWGLRGGGGNFGVVTSFEFRLHAIGPIVLGGALIYPAQMAADVLRNFREVMAAAPDEVGSAVVLTTAPPEDFIPEPARGEPICLIGLIHAGPIEAGEDALGPLREFGPPAVDTVAPIPYAAFQQMIDPSNPEGIRNYITADYLSGLPDEAIGIICAHHLTRPSPLTEIVLLPGGGAPARVPGDACAFGLERGAPFNYIIHSKWADPADDEANIAWTGELASAMKPFATGRSYLNFIGEEGTDRVVAAFGAKRYARLQALKDRYDPDNAFRLNQNIRPTGAVAAHPPYMPERRGAIVSENVELARAWFDAWDRTDWEALEKHTDRNLVMVAPEEWPEGRTFFGWDEARVQWERLKEPWDEERGEGYEILEAGDKVLVLFRWVGTGKTSDLKVETAMSCLMTPRDGKIAHLEFFLGTLGQIGVLPDASAQ